MGDTKMGTTKASTLESKKDIAELLDLQKKSKQKISNGQIVTLPASFSLYRKLIPYTVIRVYNNKLGRAIRIRSLVDNSYLTVAEDNVLPMPSKATIEIMRFFDGLTNIWEIAAKQQLDKDGGL